jgi:glucose/mannose-6-phosphate isomerase
MGQSLEESWKTMYKEISGFVDDLEAGLSVITGIDRDYKKILLCGMGASGIGGRLFVDTMYYQSDKVIAVAKTMSLPKWADDQTLFVACSYSGNTFETIDLYEKAMVAGLDVVVVTHGGKLEELAKENGNKLIVIGGDSIQPRSAIGWFIGLIGGIIEDCGGPGIRYQLRHILPWLRDARSNIEREDSYTRKIAEEIVRAVDDGNGDGTVRVPVFYGTPDLEAVVCRI